MEILSLHIVELAVIAALISLFLDFCFREGNILGWWIDLLIDIELPSSVTKDLSRDEKEEMIRAWWYKPLGGCVVCLNAWVSISLCLFFYHDWKMIFVVLLSSFFVRYFQEKIL